MSMWLVKSSDRHGLQAGPYSKLHRSWSKQVPKRFGFSDEADGPDEDRYVYIEISVWVSIVGVGQFPGHVAGTSEVALSD